MAQKVAQVLISPKPDSGLIAELKRVIGEHGHAINKILVEQEIGANILFLVDGVVAPAAIVGVTQIYVDIADGDLKVRFGSGVTKVISANP